jgi:hypothetical protein
MNLNWKKTVKPAKPEAAKLEQQPEPQIVICSGSDIALVLAKARRVGRWPGEPRKVGVDRWAITLGAPVDDFNRKSLVASEETYTFSPRLWR